MLHRTRHLFIRIFHLPSQVVYGTILGGGTMKSLLLLVLVTGFAIAGGAFSHAQSTTNCVAGPNGIRISSTQPNLTTNAVTCVLKCHWIKPNNEIGETECRARVAPSASAECQVANLEAITATVGASMTCGGGTPRVQTNAR